MKKPIEIKRSERALQYFQINWMLHDRCTYKCSYCAPSNYAGLDDWLNLDVVIKSCIQIENQVKERYPHLKMQVVFSGGEPTVWKDFKKLVEILYARGWSIHLVTNGSRSLSWWKSINVVWDYLGISLHSEFFDDDSLIEKCKYLTSKSKLLVVRSMLHPNSILFQKSIDYSKKLFNEVENLYIQWVPISYNFGGIEIKLPKYDELQLSTISDLIKNQKKHINHSHKLVVWEDSTTDIANGNHLIASSMHNFKDWICNAGIDGIFIDSRGRIYRGTCLQGSCIGSILDFSIKLYNEPIVCQKTACTCVVDVLYSKKKL